MGGGLDLGKVLDPLGLFQKEKEPVLPDLPDLPDRGDEAVQNRKKEAAVAAGRRAGRRGDTRLSQGLGDGQPANVTRPALTRLGGA